jgi:glycine/D-amino acid oxidase-like deaminating enzyme
VIGGIDYIGDETTTGQVHPFQMTNALVDAAKERGLNVMIGEATGILFMEGRRPSGVTISTDGNERNIPATDVVFAAGPWTGMLADKLLGEIAGRATEIVPR